MMFSTYTEQYKQIVHRTQDVVQEWASQFVGEEVQIKRESGSLLAMGKVKRVTAKGLDVIFSFDDGMWCSFDSSSNYSIQKLVKLEPHLANI